MAIIINDYQPSGELQEVQFPGAKVRYKIPYADDVISVEVQEKLAQGDYSVILDHLPDEGKTAFKKLLKPQLEDFVQKWLEQTPGN